MSRPPVAVALLLFVLMLPPVSAHAVELRRLIARPTHDQVKAAWPTRSDGNLAEGEASAICEADLGGVLSNCRVLMERPEGAGFGAALLDLSKYYRASPTRRACAREGGSFVFIGHDEPEPETPAKLVSTPSRWEMYKGWPEALRRQHRDGFAMVVCRPHENGEVTDCRSLYEFPEGFGVSAAALALMPRYRVSPAQRGGKPSLDDTVGIPLRFVLSPLAQCPY